jgi:hypothetical protein
MALNLRFPCLLRYLGNNRDYIMFNESEDFAAERKHFA